jgi:hypothetical protein
MRSGWPALLLFAFLAGCGTSKWTDTSRTATEQLLISDAMDRAVSRLDFRALAGKRVYLDNQAIKKAVDNEYLTSSIRQHMLASGCILKDENADADYIVELRAGAVGTDHHDVLYGVPSVNVPTLLPISGMPTTIPEIPLAKKTDQRAVVKIAVFAYNRETGRPVWQSGIVPAESQAKDFWFFGAGPFQRGTIYEGMSFAGDQFNIPLIDLEEKWGVEAEVVSVADEAYFVEPTKGIAESKPHEPGKATESKVVAASANESSQAPPRPPAEAEADGKQEADAPQSPPAPAETPPAPAPPSDAEAARPALLPAAPLLDGPLKIDFPGVRDAPPEIELRFRSLTADGDY